MIDKDQQVTEPCPRKVDQQVDADPASAGSMARAFALPARYAPLFAVPPRGMGAIGQLALPTSARDIKVSDVVG
jgi:hypothetical protein